MQFTPIRGHFRTALSGFVKGAGRYNTCLLLLSVALLFPMLTAPGETNTPDLTDPIIHVEPDSLGHFDSALTNLAATGRITIVAEGKPYQTALNPKQLKKLTDHVINSAGTRLTSVVEKVAEAYDYHLQPHEAGKVFVLLKCYTNPDDMPYVTFSEAQKSLRNLERAFRQFPTDARSQNEILTAFAASLDRRQFQILKDSSANGISVTQFSPEQQAMLSAYAVKTFLPTNGIQAQSAFLQAAQSTRSIFRRYDLMKTGIPVFGYEGPFGPKQEVWQFALSHGFRSEPGCANVVSLRNGSRFAVGDLTTVPGDPALYQAVRKLLGNGLPDPDAPTANEIAETKTSNKLSYLFTMKSAVALLNARSDPKSALPSPQLKSTISLDDVLAEKPICLFGVENSASSKTVLDGLAQTYGLEVIDSQQDSGEVSNHILFLTLRSPRYIKSLADVPKELKRLLPEPWQRASLGGVEEIVQSSQDSQMKQTSSKMDGSFVSLLRSSAVSIGDSVNHHYAPASHRLRVLIEPKIDASQYHRLVVKEADEESQSLFAFICSLNEIISLEPKLLNPTPYIVKNPDSAILRGFYSPEGSLSGIELCYRDDSGKLRAEYSFRLLQPVSFREK